MNITNLNPMVTLVDRAGNVTGYSEKIEAHLRGDLHLAFSLMIIRKRNDKIEYLLQQRADDKYHSGGLWTNTCCSHPLPNEPVRKAAQRRAFEELGIKSSLQLSTIGQICYRHVLDNNMIEHEFDNIIVSEVDSITWKKNSSEVMQVRWWTEDEISASLINTPSLFTAWFPEVFEYVKEYTSLSCCAS